MKKKRPIKHRERTKPCPPCFENRVISSLEEVFPLVSNHSKDVSVRNYIQWSLVQEGTYIPCGKTVDRLSPGVFEIVQNDLGVNLVSIPVKTQGLMQFPDTKSSIVIEEVKKFWDREDIFRKFDIAFKRGIILHGPPGSGKSSTIQLIMQDVVERGGVVVKFTHPDLFIRGYRKIREIQPDTPVVIIMEDLDAIIEAYDESEVLNILDGFNEIDKTLFLATTNYPDKLQDRVMNRPSRFDKRFRIGMPTTETRRLYFEHLISNCKDKSYDACINAETIDRWVADTDGLSIAHLKELFVAVEIIGDDYSDAIDIIKKMKEKPREKGLVSMGFQSSGGHCSDDYYD